MKIGFLTTYDKKRIEFGKKNNFECVELLTGYFDSPPDYMPGNDGWENKALSVKNDFNEAGLDISCIGGFYVNHLDPAKKNEYQKVVRDTILLAEKMNVKIVAGFAGRIINKKLEDSLPEFKKVWGEHAKFASDHNVKIAFECCPMGTYHSPTGGINCICTPYMYERCFNEVDSDNIGLEWDASHLIPFFVDLTANIRQFGHKIFHVHAKGAKIYWDIVRKYGTWYPNAIEHCHPGFGDEDWAELIKEFRRAGYHGDLNIEGWHDNVFRDFSGMQPEDIIINKNQPQSPDLEDAGLIIAKNHLKQYCPDGY